MYDEHPEYREDRRERKKTEPERSSRSRSGDKKRRHKSRSGSQDRDRHRNKTSRHVGGSKRSRSPRNGNDRGNRGYPTHSYDDRGGDRGKHRSGDLDKHRSGDRDRDRNRSGKDDKREYKRRSTSRSRGERASHRNRDKETEDLSSKVMRQTSEERRAMIAQWALEDEKDGK